MTEKKIKEKSKTAKVSREKETPKQIATKIDNMAKDIVAEIKKGIDPEFIKQQRGRSNVEFDEKKGLLKLGTKIRFLLKQ